MTNEVFQALVDSGANLITEGGFDCGQCYMDREEVCRPVRIQIGENFLLVFPCGRVEVCGDVDNLCLAAGTLTKARLFNHMC